MEDIKVVREIDNPLFKRKEVELTVRAKINPSKNEVDKMLSEKYSSNPDKIRIKKIDSQFGSNEFRITANIYETREDMFNTERFSKKEKEKIKKVEEEKNKPVEEPKTEEKTEQKSVEENKEEPAQEVKSNVEDNKEEVKE